MKPGDHKGYPSLEETLNHERCPNCGEAGFDRGEAIETQYGPNWIAIPCTCRHCGFVIEKRRFEP
jgi:predicted Zn-ribbon and HTH transcriptional regulator